MRTYQKLQDELYQIAQWSSINALLNWDMEVKMPLGSDRSFRAEQSALINGLVFEKMTHPDFQQLVASLKADQSLGESEAMHIQVIAEDLEDTLKLNKSFVERESLITGKAYSLWEEAKIKKDFKLFEPSLVQIVDLLREKSDLLGYEGHPYNALLNLYEKGSHVNSLDRLFSDVQNQLKPLIDRALAHQSERKHTAFFKQYFPLDKQMAVLKEVLSAIGYDFNRSRLDLSSHPFCTHFHTSDVRITTRVDEHDLSYCLWSAIHEMGHGFYEMGLDPKQFGMPIGTSGSMGIHESQSRFWENCIGRSIEFMEFILPILQKHFPEEFSKATPLDLFYEINHIAPSLIRTEADELTYHYHIMIRYDIEKKMIDGSLKIKDIPEYWNSLYQTYLGVEVPNDAEGCLQDVHWSFGGMGYFPTYSQGSFYAAQWYETIFGKEKNIGEIIKRSNFAFLNDWMKKNIYQYGRVLQTNQISIQASGEPLDFRHFKNYISKKLFI